MAKTPHNQRGKPLGSELLHIYNQTGLNSKTGKTSAPADNAIEPQD